MGKEHEKTLSCLGDRKDFKFIAMLIKMKGFFTKKEIQDKARLFDETYKRIKKSKV